MRHRLLVAAVVVLLCPDAAAPQRSSSGKSPRQEFSDDLYADYVSRLACRGSHIVIGTIRPRRVRLNKSESYLYTEYQLRVERWIHPGGGPPSVSL